MCVCLCAGYAVENAPGGTTAAYGSTPAPAQVLPPSHAAQSPYGSPEPAPQGAVSYSGAPGPSPSYQRQSGGQGYHPYARR